MLKTNILTKPTLVLSLMVLMLVLVSCNTYHYHSRSRGYMRTPPSTGRNRCGCLLPEKQVNQIDYACVDVQKN
ncbi:MAG TPA: hypothetical protein PK796_03575 [Bacteroidales bacterium]|nr:hypothetical protein [Bacteroidales bacterium]